MLQLMYKKLPWKPSIVSLHIFLLLLFLFFYLLMKIYASLYFSRRHFLFVFIVIHKVGYQETIERSGEEQEKKEWTKIWIFHYERRHKENMMMAKVYYVYTSWGRKILLLFFIYTSYVHTFNDNGVFFHQTHPYIDADFYLFICLYIYTYINMLPTVAQISCEHNKLSLLLFFSFCVLLHHQQQ